MLYQRNTYTHAHTQRNQDPLPGTVLNFSHKLHIITKNLTKDAVCLWDQDFTTTSICQQTFSLILWIASMTQTSAMPHAPYTTRDHWPKPLYATCRLEQCHSFQKSLSAYLWSASSIKITSLPVSCMGTLWLMRAISTYSHVSRVSNRHATSARAVEPLDKLIWGTFVQRNVK